MEKIQLAIFDETLRDGEQQVGIFFDSQTKLELASLIRQTGVTGIALMPAIHSTEAKLTRDLVDRGFQDTLIASTMMGKQYIDRSVACGVKTIILFHALSDRLLWLRDPKLRQVSLDLIGQEKSDLVKQLRASAIAKIITNLEYATSKGLKICFAAEDASRADFDFLVNCIKQFQPHIEQFLLCDTVGILTPETTKSWVHNLITATQGRTSLTVHFHNDRGLALENTIQAVRAGAKGVSGTFGGIGERAGNVALEQVLQGLKLRYGWEVAGINYDEIADVIAYQKSHQIVANQPYSPESLRCETGIHVDSLMRDRDSYYLFPQGKPEVWYGKFSGAANFRYLFEQELKQPFTEKQYQEFRDLVKQLAIEHKRSFNCREVLELLQQNYHQKQQAAIF